MTPLSILSWPKSGPTVLSSIIAIGAGRAPDLKTIARLLASSTLKPPDIWPLPVVIASLITGALTTLLSIIIANLRPILFFVAYANFLEPKLSNLKLTTELLFRLSNPGCASVKCSPDNTNCLSIL